MSLQNRVDPWGRLHAVPARGTLMGNRGILHDAAGTLRRSHAHQSWITCLTSFKGRTRALMQPGRYTELFFLDEATALAAGHRPCAECRRARYLAFSAAWTAAHGPAPEATPLPRAIDRTLHRARITRLGARITFEAARESLPTGTIFTHAGEILLAHGEENHPWSFTGYGPAHRAVTGPVTVLTPAPTVAVLRAGYRPEPHPSLGATA